MVRFICVYFTVSYTDVQVDFWPESLCGCFVVEIHVFTQKTLRAVLGVFKARRAAPSAGADTTRDLFSLQFCHKTLLLMT